MMSNLDERKNCSGEKVAPDNDQMNPPPPAGYLGFHAIIHQQNALKNTILRARAHAVRNQGTATKAPSSRVA